MKRLHHLEKQNLERILDQNGRTRSQDIIGVLDTFLASEDHQTVEDLKRRLRARGMDLDEEFVQDALDLFCRYGFAEVKLFDGKTPRYEHRHLGLHHDHLICTRCGRVEEFINPNIEELQKTVAREKGFVPLDHVMEIYGLCQACAQVRGPSISLDQAEKGESVVLCGHRGGEELTRRLLDMGLTAGVEIEVLESGGGPMVVACRGSRLALGRGMTDKILVTPAEKNTCPRLGPGRRFRRKKRRI